MLASELTSCENGRPALAFVELFNQQHHALLSYDHNQWLNSHLLKRGCPVLSEKIIMVRKSLMSNYLLKNRNIFSPGVYLLFWCSLLYHRNLLFNWSLKELTCRMTVSRIVWGTFVHIFKSVFKIYTCYFITLVHDFSATKPRGLLPSVAFAKRYSNHPWEFATESRDRWLPCASANWSHEIECARWGCSWIFSRKGCYQDAILDSTPHSQANISTIVIRWAKCLQYLFRKKVSIYR